MKKKLKITTVAALSTIMVANSAGSIFAENEATMPQYTSEDYKEEKNYEHVEEVSKESTLEDVPLEEQYFPDEVFRNYVARYDTNKNLILEKAELDAVIKINGLPESITSLKGIEYFKNLEYLSAMHSANVKEADFTSNQKLKNLYLDFSGMKNINVSGLNNLNDFRVSHCKDLEVINLGDDMSNLEKFDIYQCPNLREIIGWDSLATGLKDLRMTSTYYEEDHPNYEYSGSTVKGVDLTKFQQLKTLTIGYNDLDVPMAIAWLHLDNLSLKDFFINLNKNEDSVVVMDKKGATIEERDTDLVFKFEDKFPGFDSSRAKVTSGAVYDENTGQVTRTSPNVTYTYDCGFVNENLYKKNFIMNVTLKFTPYTEIYTPETKRLSVPRGTTLSIEAAEMIANKEDMPANTKYEWKTVITDTTTLGEKRGTITANYPDGTSEDVEAIIDVVEAPLATLYTPEVDPSGIITDQGIRPSEEEIKAKITNLNQLPADTKYEWQEINEHQPGEQLGKIKVVYPDGSFDEDIEMKVYVRFYNEMYEPEMNTAGITTYLDEMPAIEKIKEVIINANTFPEGTTYAWKNLNVSTVGKTTGIATVTYPDESVDEVSIEVLVEEKEQEPGTGEDENIPSNPSQPEEPTNPESPTQPEGSIEGVQTGDATQVGLWTAIMGASVGIFAYLKRKKKNFHI
ncbi:MAG: hypothetical protein K2F55_00960 [Erysipelotrichaceae bacterium]|nr:hypothetical protein [Erysipelotrichaceae bacterium]